MSTYGLFFGRDEDLLELLQKEVGVVLHSYHGANGDFEGPQCSKILENLNKLEPYLSDVEGVMYLNLLKSFQQVKNKVFGSVFGLDWEIVLKDFADN